jgi:hypothetical protein
MDAATQQLNAIREFLGRKDGAALAALPVALLADELKKTGAQARRFFILRQPDASRLALRFDEHLELSLDGFVIDPRLGTIGFVVLLDPTSARKDVTETIEKAAYLRHVLGQKRAESIEPNLLPYAIEVLFVSTAAQDETSAIVGEAVRESWRETTLPHALGIGFAHLLPSPDERQLRRAFCWLLTATEVWLTKLDGIDAGPAQEWTRLQLENFRRPRTRTWTKARAHGLHVLHGPNGSGKSTMAEGFEFLVTGNSARLAPAPVTPTPNDAARFRPLVWQRPGGSAANAVASVRLFAGATPPLLERTTAPTPQAPPAIAPAAETEHAVPKNAPPPADAFRLNQHLTDRLMLQSAGERARTWLDAFFPGADRLRRERREARATLQEMMSRFVPPEPAPADSASAPARSPAEVADALAKRTAAVVQLAAQVAGPSGLRLSEFVRTLIGPDNFERLQSLSTQDLKSRAAMEDVLYAKKHKLDNSGALVERLVTAFKEDAALLTRWKALITPPLIPLLERLGEDAYKQSSPVAASTATRGDTFNAWLRHIALVDLHERALAVATVAADLPENERADLARILAAEPPAGIHERQQKFKRRLDELRKNITTLDTEVTRRIAAGDISQRVAETDLEPFLTAIAGGLFAPHLQPGDEGAMLDALRHRKEDKVGTLQLGLPHWTSPLIATVNQRQEAVKRLLPVTGDPQQAPLRAQSLVTMVQAALTVVEHDSATATQLAAELVRDGLDAAIDELVALFTPARWAYPPLETEFKETDAGDQLQLRTIAEHDAAAILNTAELNTVALALYLLCAPRVANPYQVVFLDDPLQNMDELTVTTVGRGLARLMRAWRGKNRLKGWDVVLLLHGAEDCARIAREAPASLYAFPWLTPSHVHGDESAGDSAGDDVVALAGTSDGILQPLAGLFVGSGTPESTK